MIAVSTSGPVVATHPVVALHATASAETFAMIRHRNIRIDASWTALPGLFTARDLEAIEELEVCAVPLVLRGAEVLYGVYVRELDACLSAPKPFVRPSQRPSFEPATR